MRKTLAALAWAAIPALLLSACNGNATGGSSGITPTTNGPAASTHGRAHHNDNGAGDLHAGGATFPAYGYNLGDQPSGGYTTSQATPGPGSLLYNAAANNGDGNNYFYCLTGSGYGRHEFEGSVVTGGDACQPLGQSPSGFGGRGNPIDFVGSDVAMPSTEYSTFETNYGGTYGDVLELPTYGGPIVIPYINEGGNGLTGLGSKQLKLSTWTYCAIANGSIGYWDDDAITADNGGVAVASHQPITFYYRSDGSGTTFLFENFLKNGPKGCNQNYPSKYANAPYGNSASRNGAWPFPQVSVSTDLWTGPGTCATCAGAPTSGSTFTGESGNPGILACVQNENCLTASAFPYATGYAEGAWAASAQSDGGPPVAQAALQSGGTFASPTDPNLVAGSLKKAAASKIVYGEGGDGITLGSSNPQCQLYIPPSAFDQAPGGDYPIVGLSYFLFYTKNNVRGGSNHLTDIKGLIQYLDSSAWNNALPNLEYTPLPASTQKKVQQAAFGKGSHHTGACLVS